MTTIPSSAAATPATVAQAADVAKTAQANAVIQKVGATMTRAADGDYKTKGTGHMVKDSDGDYKPTVTGSSATSAVRQAAATQAALSALVKGG